MNNNQVTTGSGRPPVHSHGEAAVERADARQRQLDEFRVAGDRDSTLSTEQSVRIAHDDDLFQAGERGLTLMEDFHLREKTTHFGAR